MSATSPVGQRDMSTRFTPSRRDGMVDRSYGNGSSTRVGGMVAAFIALWVFIWVLVYTFRPSWVCCGRKGGSDCSDDKDRCNDRREGKVDRTKILWCSFVITIIIAILIWLISSSSRNSCSE